MMCSLVRPSVGLLVICLYVRSICCAQMQSRKFYVVERFDNCPNERHLIFFVRNYTYEKSGSNLIVNGYEDITKDSEQLLWMSIEVEKCKDKSNPDTCEYFVTWKWDNACTFFAILPPFRSYIQAHSPAWKCPLKKGTYKVTNATMEGELGLQFLKGDSRVLWKLRIIVKNPRANVVIECLDLHFRIVSVRTKS
ncbi:unnamed protein product [Bemisia tabaci]|uniref:Uncharacterized protein n=1 Tax=Bemisia tabaci TaxID=7038 RepID=A0A9P0EWW9_BEMTA|nr:unnamed protein product [Bemisia tabaci]